MKLSDYWNLVNKANDLYWKEKLMQLLKMMIQEIEKEKVTAEGKPIKRP